MLRNLPKVEHKENRRAKIQIWAVCPQRLYPELATNSIGSSEEERLKRGKKGPSSFLLSFSHHLHDSTQDNLVSMLPLHQCCPTGQQ